MKLLKIENNKGHFLVKDNYEPIDKITKEGLLNLVELTLKDEVDFDEYSEETIKDHAHQIIYKNIHDKLKDLKSRRQEFVDESQRLYLEDYEKYKEDLQI